jgi:hypothetical protein
VVLFVCHCHGGTCGTALGAFAASCQSSKRQFNNFYPCEPHEPKAPNTILLLVHCKCEPTWVRSYLHHCPAQFSKGLHLVLHACQDRLDCPTSMFSHESSSSCRSGLATIPLKALYPYWQCRSQCMANGCPPLNLASQPSPFTLSQHVVALWSLPSKWLLGAHLKHQCFA